MHGPVFGSLLLYREKITQGWTGTHYGSGLRDGKLPKDVLVEFSQIILVVGRRFDWLWHERLVWPPSPVDLLHCLAV